MCARVRSLLLHAVWKVKNLTIMTFNQRLGSHLKSIFSFFFFLFVFHIWFRFIICLLHLILHLFIYAITAGCRILYIFGFLWLNTALQITLYHDPLYSSKKSATFCMWPCAVKLGQIWNNFMQRRKTELWIMWLIACEKRRARAWIIPKPNQSEKSGFCSAAHETDRERAR